MIQVTYSISELNKMYSDHIATEYPNPHNRPIGGYDNTGFAAYILRHTGRKAVITTPHMDEAGLWPPQRMLPYYTFDFESESELVAFKLKWL